MKKILNTLILLCICSYVSAQTYSAYTKYGWDQWHSNEWAYVYSGDWCFAVPGKSHNFTYYGFMTEETRTLMVPIGNAKDFFFRFKYRELGLKEFNRKEWKMIKKNDGWYESECTFEYYISDDYPTLKDALSAKSWPCAKYYVKPNKPVILKSVKAKVKVHLTDNDEVRVLNFFIDDVAFAISVHWDFEDNDLTYRY